MNTALAPTSLSQKDTRTLTRCLACNSPRLFFFASLGEQALANTYRPVDSTEVLDKYPLTLNMCLDCFHMQQSVSVDRALLFDEYPYVSGTSSGLGAYFTDFAASVCKKLPALGRKARVLEIASNDGTLLAEFKKLGAEVQGVEPAKNLRKLWEANGIPTVPTYWGAQAVAALKEKYDIIVAMNVLGHVSDPYNFLLLAKSVLAPGGRIYVQTSQAMMLENGEFDTCYHEHLSFFTVSSFLALARQAGLRVGSISHAAVHGVSYVVELHYDRAATDFQNPAHFSIGREEQRKGYYSLPLHFDFSLRIKQTASALGSLVARYKKDGYLLAAYGAAAKGMVLLGTSGLKPAFIVDDNPLKIGRLCCLDVPVVGPKEVSGLSATAGDDRFVWLILPWNMQSEIVGRLKELRGPKFASDVCVTAFPTVEVVS